MAKECVRIFYKPPPNILGKPSWSIQKDSGGKLIVAADGLSAVLHYPKRKLGFYTKIKVDVDLPYDRIAVVKPKRKTK